MKHTILTGAALLLAVTACGQQEAPPRTPEETGVDGSQEQNGGSDPDPQSPYVLNRHGDENGFDDQRPTDYVATEFTTFSDLEWDEWSDEVARGEGEMSGTWCMDQGCQDDPYDVDVELGDPVDVNGTTYFSTYTITDYDDDMSQEMRQAMEDADGGRLSVPNNE